MIKKTPLNPALLYKSCPVDSFKFENTDELDDIDIIIGQERAIESIHFGIRVDGAGYNIFASGLTGTGRTTTVKRLLEGMGSAAEAPDDVCYVNNFKNPEQPLVIHLPAGKGRELRKDMKLLVKNLVSGIPALLESDEYQKAINRIVEPFNTRRTKIINDFEKKLMKKGFKLMQIQLGPLTKMDIVPNVEEQPIQIEQLQTMVQENKFPPEKLKAIEETREKLLEEMRQIFKATQQIESEVLQ